MIAQMTGISKIIPDGAAQRVLLNNINLTVQENEIVALTGNSGSGISTLLRVLSCLEDLNIGEYLFNDEIKINNMPRSSLSNMRKTYIGFMGFEPEFVDSMTVNECLDMPLCTLSFSYKEQKNMKAEVLKIVGLNSKLNKPLNTLQYYEKICISVARAFIKKPLLVVADNPCKQLHSDEATALLELLKIFATKYESTLVYTTYDPFHLKIATRVVFMKDGQIIEMEEN